MWNDSHSRELFSPKYSYAEKQIGNTFLEQSQINISGLWNSDICEREPEYPWGNGGGEREG